MGKLFPDPDGPFYPCQMIKSFIGMELSSSSDEMKDLAALCSEFQLECYKEAADIDLQKLIDLEKDVSILLSNQNFNIPCFGEHVDNGNRKSLSSSLLMASFLNMMGIACSKLKSYDESLVYLKEAEEILPDLESYDDSLGCVDCCSMIWHENQFQLYKVKRELHKLNPASKLIEECPDHMKKILKIKKKMIVDENHFELGDANMDVSSAYLLSSNFTEAVPYLVKSLEIYERLYASDHPRDIFKFRRYLCETYAQAQEYKEAIIQYGKCQTALLEMGINSGLFFTVSVDRGICLVLAKRYVEAISQFEYVTCDYHNKIVEKMLLAKAYQYLALACFHSGKFDDAIKHLESSSEILDKLEINPQDQLQRRLFEEQYDRLIVFIGKVCEAEQAISLLEDVLGKLKEKFGEKCLEVGYCSHVLGFNYFKSDNFEVAAQNFAYAKRVLGDHLGPSDVKTLTSHFSLAVTYAKMRSFDLAIEYQEEVIEHLKGLGGSQQYFLDAAILDLKQMKEAKSSEEPSCSSRVPTDVSSLLTEIMEQVAKSKRRGRRSY